MKEYNSMYLGICINNNDPEKRGRVQVFIPHIMPALYEGWNEKGEDIQISCVGDNLQNSLTSDQIQKLRKILPWAEAASPIVGTSSPGNLVDAVVGAVSDAASSVYHKVFDQSPVSQPTPVNSKDESALFSAASKYGGISPDRFAANTSHKGECGIGARSILGGLTGNSYFAQGLGGNADSLARGNNYLTNSGYFGKGKPADLNAFSDPSKIPIGTVVAATGGHKNQGHVQVWTGSKWVSDFSQNPNGGSAISGTNGILKSSGGVDYNNFTVYYPTKPIGGTSAATDSKVADRTSVSGEQAAANVHQSPESSLITDDSEEDPLYGSAADPEVKNQATGTSATGGDSSTLATSNSLNAEALPPGLKPYAQDFINAGQKYNIDPNFLAAISWNETGGGTSKAFREGNNAMGISNAKGPLYGFGSVGESIDRQARTLANPKGPYAGARTIGQIGNIYSPIGAENDFYGTNSSWIPTVGKFYTKLTGKDPNSQVLAGDGSPLPPNTQQSPNTSLVNNPSPHGAMATQNLNNTAKGLFTYPGAGAMLWVFFRDGNPMYPVYFAASYSNEEWQSAYRYGSPGPGYTPEATSPDNPITSTGGIMNLGGVGGIRWEDTNNPKNRDQDQHSLMLFGEDGSNIFFEKGHHQFFSKFDRSDKVEGDRWTTTLGFAEDWTQGDYNQVVMGDVYIKVGNVSQAAVDAATRIQQIIKECQEPLSKTD